MRIEKAVFAAFRFCLVVIAVLAGGPARAAEVSFSKAYNACMDKSGGVTASMLDCASAELKLQDARLNKAYQALAAELSPERKTQLRDVQRQWIEFRRANCAFYADPGGGTSAGVAASSCFLSATATRAEELETLKQ